MKETQLERLSNDYSHLKQKHSELQDAYSKRGQEINRLNTVLKQLRADYAELFNRLK